MRGILILSIYLALMALAPAFGVQGHEPIKAGNFAICYFGLLFLYWGVVLMYAARSSSSDWLLRFLNRNEHSLLLGVAFGVLGLFLTIVGLLPSGAHPG